MNKKRLYFDMDNVFIDPQSNLDTMDEKTKVEFEKAEHLAREAHQGQ